MDIVITGSTALEYHALNNGLEFRPTNDVDIIMSAYQFNLYASEYRLLEEITTSLSMFTHRFDESDFVISNYCVTPNRFGKSGLVVEIKSGGRTTMLEISLIEDFENDIGLDNFIYNRVIKNDNPKLAGEHNVYLASPKELLVTKLSHRYLRNSPHFAKTMADIKFIRNNLIDDSLMSDDTELLNWLKAREGITYDYNLPNLNRTKEEFFSGDGITYYLDHDSVHEAVAFDYSPAYTKFQKPGAEVAVDMNKFFELPEHVRMQAALEESMVLCVERSLMPFFVVPSGALNITQDVEFGLLRFALEKVCTSITSGRFREYCWENYYAIEMMAETIIRHNDGPVARLNSGLQSGKIKRLENFEYNPIRTI